MSIGKKINKFADDHALAAGLVGLVLAPVTGGSSMLLALQAVGATKLIGFGVESLEETLIGKGKKEK